MKELNLQEIREQLDQIDRKLVELFEERMRLSGDVAEFKIQTGKAVYDGEREKQKLGAVRDLAHGEFNQQAVGELFSQIMTISRRYQYQILAEYGKRGDTGFCEVEELNRKGVRVVYQGVEGAYSHAAALKSPEQCQGGQGPPKAPLHGVSLLSVCTYPIIFSQKCKVAGREKIGYNGGNKKGVL